MIDTNLGAAGLLDFLPDEQLPSATLLEDKSKPPLLGGRPA
ncbi:MAG TPA: hypothetical protein VL336_02895 [Sphingomicrobium sp.]|jgi:hypothetical protein|nr:hypothetical protein [Sphingomicrobium sp.]